MQGFCEKVLWKELHIRKARYEEEFEGGPPEGGHDTTANGR